jgi:hypothetical protein
MYLNKFYQPIVINKIYEKKLLAYVIIGGRKVYVSYCFNSEFTKNPTMLNKYDLIVGSGTIGMRLSNKVNNAIGNTGISLTLKDFVKDTWIKQQYSAETFKDDEIRSLFNGSDEDLQELI